MDQPAWMAAAWAELGVRERAGAPNMPDIVRYFHQAGHAEISDDETPWCAAFVGAMLARAGVSGTRSLLARSYLDWGEKSDSPSLGAICVLTRGADPGAGHVGFLVGRTEKKIALLGGNQSDAVTVEAFDAGRLIGFRWPATAKPEVDPPLQAPFDAFAEALRHVLKMEGGYSDDPYDPGGPTNRGVTLETFAKHRGETVDASSRARLIAALKRIDDATLTAIYAARYWRPASCAELSAPLALMHFDAAVNHGVGGAIRFLQQAVGADVDGEIGPQTRAAAKRAPVTFALQRYAELRRERYRALPHFWRFGRGWLNRVDATLKLADAWAKDGGRASADEPTPIKAARSNGDEAMASDNATADDLGKWWAHSKTVWGAIISAAATVIPTFGPLFGIDLPADVIRDAGQQTIATAQAVVALFGTFLAIYGRLTAAGPLLRRPFNVKI